MKKLKNNSVARYESWPKIFNMSEAEVLQIIEAATKYEESGDSTRHWCDMYFGVHHESVFESGLRGWLACYQWLQQKNNHWIPASENLEFGIEVIGFHPDWVHDDYNPNGTRIGFFQEGIDEPFFSSAMWDNEADCYEIDEKMPTHYMYIPLGPK
ncbi:hypothetical protein [Runella zeae]|uniref:hypothetical protein n=1 Tax=Runella zeae TaxID=94255 RepID=UPI00235607C0|nr:hypothetical protein [Runella zeae]